MRRITPELYGAVSAALLATVAFALWAPAPARWASSLPGHALGVLGLALMLWAAFGYAWRKRRPAPGAQTMRAAMQWHVLAGLLGPYLVILHSGFAFHGVAGVAALLMVLVVASGVVGRTIMSVIPTQIVLADPVRSAMLDADLARLETESADLARRGDPDPSRRDALRRAMAAVRHEQDFQRQQWQQPVGVLTMRRTVGVWWYLHVPASAALWVLAGAHVVAASYYATFSR